jgi:hypothetical protein
MFQSSKVKKGEPRLSEQEQFGAKFMIPKELHRRLKAFCANNDVGMSDLVTQILKEYLDIHETPPPKKGRNSQHG